MTTSRTLGKNFHQATITLLLLVLSYHASAQIHTSSQHQNLHNPLSRTTAIVMVASVVGFFILACLCICIRQRSDPDSTPFARMMSKPQGLNPESLMAFPTFEYSQVKNHKIGKQSLECAICICEFEDNDMLRLLPKCNHVFHADCIDTWLKSQTTCPVCRADLVLKSGETFTGLNFQSDEPETSEVRSTAEVLSSSPAGSQGGSPVSWSTKLGTSRFFPRSHSTGHSFIQHGGDVDRFTLILPANVRTELINTAFKRTKSCEFDFSMMKSPRKGYTLYEGFNRDGRFDRWEFSSTPPFIRKCTSIQFRGSEDSTRVTTTKRSLTKSITMPVRCLFPEKESNKEIFSDRLRFNSNV